MKYMLISNLRADQRELTISHIEDYFKSVSVDEKQMVEDAFKAVKMVLTFSTSELNARALTFFDGLRPEATSKSTGESLVSVETLDSKTSSHSNDFICRFFCMVKTERQALYR